MNILIGCSSKEEIEEKYFDLAKNVSNFFADNGWNLVFGAASFGMLGVCHDTFSNKKKEIISHTVSKYEDDLINLNGDKKYVHNDTFNRTKYLYNDADVILFLPGGTGTTSEFFAILEENRTVTHPKKVILFNYEGFYDDVLKLINTMVEKKFNNSNIFNFFTTVKTIDELFFEINKIK